MAKTISERCYPLDFIKQRMNEREDSFLYEIHKQFPDIKEDDVVEYLMSGVFPIEDKSSKVVTVTNHVCEKYCIPGLKSVFGKTVNWQRMFTDRKYRMKNNMDVLDFFVPAYFWDKWAKNKQVYRPDCDFLDALLGSDKVYVTAEMFKHLPCDTFYIDFTKCKMFLPIVGAFVYVRMYDYLVSIYVQLLSDELIFFSNNFYIPYDKLTEELELPLDKEMVGENSTPLEVFMGQKANNDYATVNANLMNSACILFLTYLISEKPDVEESSVTKHTYKPSSIGNVRNKFSEIQQWEVGVRFGTQIRDYERKLNQEGKLDVIDLSGKVRKPVRPHFRKGHWHRYWVGKGRTKLEIKWIMPTFVGGKEAQDVVIHA